MRYTAKELGDAGEDHVVTLLQARGYRAEKLPANSPTYDVRASINGHEFFVSVKVSREKQHVRLGARTAVLRLVEGNFVFAFMPLVRQEITAFEPEHYQLLILPAALVREDSVPVHDAYWAARGSGTGYSVMVKGYGRNHREIWPRWLQYRDAWRLLPS